MAGKNPSSKQDATGRLIQFTLPGLIAFTVSLIASTGLLIYGLYYFTLRNVAADRKNPVSSTATAANHLGMAQTNNEGAWGQLVVREIQLERPPEYVAFAA